MSHLELLVTSAIIIFTFINIVFVVAHTLKDNSIIDIAWGMGFVLVTLFHISTYENSNWQKIVFLSLIIIWGIRLSSHIFLRKRGHGEDFRYKKWRETWKFFLIRSYFQIFILQGVIMFLMTMPLSIIDFSNTRSFSILTISLGILVWTIGFLFESIGDYQLTKFKQNPTNKGKIITTGLWKYTRHPNYFGEVSLWWGISIFALSFQRGELMLISPIIITFLLLFVSGIPMLEAKYKGNSEFEEYKKRTSAFFPMFKI